MISEGAIRDAELASSSDFDPSERQRAIIVAREILANSRSRQPGMPVGLDQAPDVILARQFLCAIGVSERA